MTLESTINQNRYVGNGATTVFPFTFKVWKTDQVAVFVGNGIAEQEVSASCAVEITPSGGTVTFQSAPEAGRIIVIQRSMPFVQEDDYRNGTRFDSEEIEDRFDMDCAERQDLKLEIGRTLKLPATSSKTPEQYMQDVADLKSSVEYVMDALEDIGSGTCGSGTVVIASGGTAPISLGLRFGDQLTPEDFGAKGDGETDDTEAFAALEDTCEDVRINLHGKTYKVLTPPCKNYYYNGFWKYDVDFSGEAVQTKTGPAYNDNVVMEYGSVHSLGSGTSGRNYCILNDSPIEDVWKTNLKNVVAIGENTLTKSIEEHSSYLSDYIAIGRGVMSEADMTSNPGHNIGIGQFALHELTTGDRNIAIGSLAMLFTQDGSKNIAIGRDCAQTMIGGSQNLCIGYQALAGLGWTAGSGYLEAHNSVSPSHSCFIGSHSAPLVSGSPYRVTTVGAFSLTNAKSISNSTVIGSHNLELVGYNKSVNQYDYANYSADPETASFTAASSKAVLTPVSSSVVSDATVGKYIHVSIPGIGDALVEVESKTASTITVKLTGSAIDGTSGDAVVYGCEKSTEIGYEDRSVNRCAVVGELSFNKCVHAFGVSSLGSQICGDSSAEGVHNRSTFIGYKSAYAMDESEDSVIVGAQAGVAASKSRNAVVLGAQAAFLDSGVVNSVSIGVSSGVNSGISYNNVFVGHEAGKVLEGSTSYDSLNEKCRRNTAVGFQAMQLLVDGSTTVSSLRDSTAIGAYARVSGSSQVQLGGADTTVYAYGAVQDRSDARDKTDIRDTELGLDFLLSLRPVDFRWDYRDSYVDVADDGTVTRAEKDGSRKRVRYHHGLIAQEVKAVLDEKGIDFGGYQDHKINGGCDILTLGYEEFVAPIIKALQEIDARLKALEA